MDSNFTPPPKKNRERESGILLGLCWVCRSVLGVVKEFQISEATSIDLHFSTYSNVENNLEEKVGKHLGVCCNDVSKKW